MSSISGPALYLLPLAAIWLVYLGLRRRSERRAIAIREAAHSAGMTEPASLHPIVDPNSCIGSGACARACPEGEVIRVVRGKAELVDPTRCIGHGACMTACPVEAITLVFGTEKRGVDIPLVRPNFETDAPGIFIAGELGGMGLVRNAVEQGRQAMEAIRKYDGVGGGSHYDVVIVGAGPAGFSASLAAMEHGLKSVTVEQDTLGGTVAHFPRNKIVMTAPVRLPMVGRVNFTETTKEALLEFWQDVERRTGVKINYQERADAIARKDGLLEVKTTQDVYLTRTVLLTIGRRGTPRRLEVPGEEMTKVVYRLIDPEQYRQQHVLVVGGGDSALEAASSIADQPGTSVTLSYRGDAFSRAKEKNRQKVRTAEEDGRVQVFLQSDVKAIAPHRVELEHHGQTMDIPNDAVIICAGGILPTSFLKEIGITVETKHGSA